MDLISEKPGIGVGTSKEDRLALISMNKSKRLVGGHYQLVLPWKPGSPSFDDNRTVAEARLNNLKKQLDKNPELRQKYTAIIEDYLAKSYTGKVEK